MELEMQEAYSEVYEIINQMPEEYRKKLPNSVKSFFENHRIKNYQISLDKNNLFDKSKLKQQTLNIIAMLNIKYWCPNDKIKKQLIEKYNGNEEKYIKEIEEKYNIDNIFKNRQSTSDSVSQNMQVIEYKEPRWYQKIFKKILSIFKIKHKE